MIVHDWEVFSHDFLMGTLDTTTNKITTFVNDLEGIIKFWHEHKQEIWVGYYSTYYDNIILAAAVLNRYNAEQLAELSNDLVKSESGGKGVFIVKNKHKLNNFPMTSVDLMMDGTLFSLKQNEAYMGMNIHESNVDFEIDRKLTDSEIEEVTAYNDSDLRATLGCLKAYLPSLKTKMAVVRENNLPNSYIGKTSASLTAAVLMSKNKGLSNPRKFENFQLAQLPLNWNEPILMDMLEFYNKHLAMGKESKMKKDVLGVEHEISFGGIHGARKNFICKPQEKRKLLWLDVSSYYPAILCNFSLLSRKVEPAGMEAFKDIVQTRLKLKEMLSKPGITEAEERELKERANKYKLLLNAPSGAMKSQYNPLYDPEYNRKMCATGQLCLIDLIMMLHRHSPKHYFDLVQSNTDGICVEVIDSGFGMDYSERLIDEVCRKWEEKTGFILEKTACDNLYEKDVNNYFFGFKEAINDKGEMYYKKVKTKGGYCNLYGPKVRPYDGTQHNLEIVDRAVVEYFLYNIPVEQTIVDPTNNAIEYQLVKKIGTMYGAAIWQRQDMYSDTMLNIPINKANRIFASSDTMMGGVYKQKMSKEEGNLDKVEGTPERCLVYNDSIEGKKISEMQNIDFNWYIDLAQKRINDILGIKPERKPRKNAKKE